MKTEVIIVLFLVVLIVISIIYAATEINKEKIA